ncbi:MAG: deoxyguanosinetriphosphate triphosphohydrolase [Microbacteriaceae bacterium]
MTLAESKQHYTEFDRERMLPETHSSRRSDFARDRARILHSSALRRLSAKTQVLSPTAGVDFARNRLTHTLEVAQVGRELASALNLDPDIVDAACLAHDLGHPPFGHNGEQALNDWSQEFGGFEGNAQSLRLLSRLEPKVVDETGQSYGLNLTRASLDASIKYPWYANDAVDDPSGRQKFGVYQDDRDVFEWMREGAPLGRSCIEAQVMDLSDDIAYSVHDFEDAIFGGYINLEEYLDQDVRQELINSILSWVGDGFTSDDISAALERMQESAYWLLSFDGSRWAQAKLKNLTSQLIGRFVQGSLNATRAQYPDALLHRYNATIILPAELRAEIAVLKGIVAAFVMKKAERQPIYLEQRALLSSILDHHWRTEGRDLDAGFAGDFAEAATDAEKKRVIVDQVASLTDQTAMNFEQQLGRI